MKQPREFCWLLLQIKPFFRLHLGSYICIVITGILTLLDSLIVKLLISLRSRRKHKAWGASPRIGAKNSMRARGAGDSL